MYLVYQLEFPDGKKYVGMTCRKAQERWSNGKDYNRFIQEIIKNHGWDSVKKTVLQTNLSKEEADELERKLIKDMKLQDRRYGYNISDGGNNSHPRREKGCIFSEEHRKHLSEAAKNRSEEHIRKLKESKKGQKPSPQTIAASISAWKGHHHSEETKKKISEAGKNQSDETKRKRVESRRWYKPPEELKRRISEAQKGVPKPEWLKAKWKQAIDNRSTEEWEKISRTRSTPIVCLTTKTIYLTKRDAHVFENASDNMIDHSCETGKPTKGKIFVKFPKGTDIGLIQEQYPDFKLGDHVPVRSNCIKLTNNE